MNETAQVAVSATQHRLKMVRVSWVLGAFVASAATAAVGASFLLTAAVLNSDLATQIRNATGFTTTIHGAARFSLLPQPHIDIENITFANPKAGLWIDTNNFVGYLRVLPLLAGRVEVGHAVLNRPKMQIDVDDRPITPESAIGRAADAKPASPEAAASDRAQLAIVDFVNGSARLKSQAAPQGVRIDDINVRADWRSLDASATLTGQFSFGGVPMQLKAWFAQPIEALRGADSMTTVQLDSDVVKLAAAGRISAAPRLQYDGNLVVTTPSLRALAQLTGLPFAKHGKFANFDLHCDALINNNVATLTNVNLRLDGNEYEGTLAVQATGGLRQLSGTLATNVLDVAPFLDGVPQPNAARGWNNDPLELTDLGFTNLDLRLSASQLRLNDIEIYDAALSVLTRPSFIDLSLAEGVANGGAIRGRLTLAGQGKMIEMRAIGNASGVDLQPLLRGNTVKHPLSGSMNSTFVLEGKGESFAALMQTLSGHAQFDVSNGQLTGLDLGPAARTSGTKAARKDPAQSVTNFSAANFGLQINRGIASIVNGRLQTEAMAMNFGGDANLGERSLDLWVLAQPVTDPAKPASGGLRLAIKGPWSDVHVTAEQPPEVTLPPAVLPPSPVVAQ